MGAKNPGGMCDYAAQYVVYYSDPPWAQLGVDREFPERPVAKIVQNIGGLEKEEGGTRPGCLSVEMLELGQDKRHFSLGLV